MRYGLSLQRSSLQALEVESRSAKQKRCQHRRPRKGRKRPTLEGYGSNNKRLIHSHSLAPSRRTSANWSGRGRTCVQRGSDDSTEDDEPASRNLRGTRQEEPPPCLFPFGFLCLRLGAPAPGGKIHQSCRTHRVCGGAST